MKRLIVPVLLLIFTGIISCKHSPQELIINHPPSPPDTIPATGCDTLNVTYSKTILPILQLYCVGCHSGAVPSGGISLVTYNDVLTQVANGKLMGSIEWQSGYSPMPKNGSKLSNCMIRQFNIWITAGAPNN